MGKVLQISLISKSDHCQKTFELTLTYICVVSLKMFRYSRDEAKYCAVSFLSYPHLHAPWWHSPKLAFFSLPCLHLREDTQCVTVNHVGPQNSMSALSC